MTNIAANRLTLPLSVIGLFLLFALGSANLKIFPIGNDEYNSLSHIEQPESGTRYDLAGTVQSVIDRSQQHSPLYFLLLNVWRTFAGADLFALRLFSLLCGLLTVAATFQLAAACCDRQMGLAALLVITFLAYHLFYSHTARMYTLLPLFSVWVIWSYWKVIAETGVIPRRRWLSLLASAALILYLHYFGSMILAAIGLYHLLFVPKHRRWWLVALHLLAAGLCFLPWLPVAIAGFSNRISLANARLPVLESIFTYFLVFSNGLFFLPLLTAAFAARNYSRLNPAEKFILLITAFTLLLAVLANELTPILVARRMRYMTVLTAPFCCSLLIGLRFLPRWNLIRYPALILWIASFVVFSRSDALLHYANKLEQNLHKMPHYQDFIYESERLPGHNELILSFHPDLIITVTKTLRYYRAALADYAHLAHITYDAAGQVYIQSVLTPYASLDAIAENATGIWVIHDPQQTDLGSPDVVTDWLGDHYHACQRFVEKSNSVIDYYLRINVPCGLVTAAAPLGIRYDNGTELGNLLTEQSTGALRVYLRWLHTIDAKYSFTLQAFNKQAEKVLQADRVISGEPVDIVQFDISALPAGEYTMKFIVYDFTSGASQPGAILSRSERFEREIEVAQFSVGQ